MKLLLTGIFTLTSLLAAAQYDPDYKVEEPESPVNFGIGLGIDYGGIGGKLSFFPVKNFGVFGAVGYNFVKAGFNGGAIVRILPGKKVCPYLTGMYGYNAVILVVGANQYNEIYYGPTFGGGIELHFGNGQNFMNFGLMIPVRPQEFRDDLNALKNNSSIEIGEPSPIGISIGYHFKLQ